MHRAPVLLWTSGICRSFKSSLVLSNAASEAQSCVDILSASSCDGRSVFFFFLPLLYTETVSSYCRTMQQLLGIKMYEIHFFMIWFILTVR